MKAAEDWDEQDLLDLILYKHEENIQLDFKARASLCNMDSKKNEISKDVSAFANSVGGTIVYGIDESSDEPHYATGFSPIAPKDVSKEWVEQVINSRIQPRISGVLINPVELVTKHTGEFVYVVVVPESYTAHQAHDKKYYKRFNFQSIPMEDYEVRQVMNRARHPSYKVELHKDVNLNVSPVKLRFSAVVQNMSEIVGHEVSAVLFVPRVLV